MLPKLNCWWKISSGASQLGKWASRCVINNSWFSRKQNPSSGNHIFYVKSLIIYSNLAVGEFLISILWYKDNEFVSLAEPLLFDWGLIRNIVIWSKPEFVHGLISKYYKNVWTSGGKEQGEMTIENEEDLIHFL